MASIGTVGGGVAPPSVSFRREWFGFAAMCLGLFMAILDVQIVAAALPRIATSLGVPLDRLSWVQTAYLITEVIAIAMSGRLARAMATRRLFAAATCAFSLTSLGCALSHSFEQLIVWRTLQGFTAGTIIPSVFAVGYKMFPKRLHARAVLIAGAVAMFAPSIGPFLGGYIAEKLTWNWLFYINVPLGIVSGAVVFALVRVDHADMRAWRSIDVPAFVALALALGSMQLALKLAPEDRWVAERDYALIALMVIAGAFFIRRCVTRHDPLVDFSPLRVVGFSTACAFNFVLGAAIFGSIYTLPLFLGFVRYHTPLEIGAIMTVMGVSQLAVAPLATLAARRLPPQLVALIGFGLFAAGALTNAFQTPTTDAAGLVLPQVLRGASLLFCILPITDVALGSLPIRDLSNASGVLNFMRNVGGAVGIGLVDTIVSLRPAAIGTHLVAQLARGDARTAAFVGVPVGLLKGVDVAHADPADLALVKPVLERAAATVAFNEAWLLIGGLLLVSLLLIPFLRSPGAAALGDEPVLERLTIDVPAAIP